MPHRAPPFVRPLVFVLVFAAGLVAAWSGVLPNPISHQPAWVEHDFRPFWEAWRLVEDEYVDRSAVNPQHMADGAISGMLDTLGDTGHTAYLPRRAHRLDEDLSGKMEGIGVRVGMRQGRAVIVAVLPGTPAQQAGLKPGDQLLQVDGKDLKEKSLTQIIEMVVGKAGTQLQLTVGRGSPEQSITLSITRAQINVPFVSWHMLQDRPLAHVAILQFGEKVDDQLKEAIKAARDQGARGLVIDIRPIPAASKRRRWPLPASSSRTATSTCTRTAQGRQTPKPVLPGGIATDIPIVVLIDEGTASSSEIFAGAIQDHKRGQLVGTKTYGTGTVLQPYRLSNGSAVLLAVAEWLTPNGRRIWHEGIKPDVPVPLPQGATILLPDESGKMSAADLDKSDDKQLVKGVEVLGGQVK